MEGIKMISYKKLWDTMKAKGVTQYTLTNTHNISKATMDRLRHDMPISTITVDRLCDILECDVNDIMEHVQSR